MIFYGTDELSCLDDLIKHIRPPYHDMDEGRRVINDKFQCLGQLPISCQIVGNSSKPALISPEALGKEALKPQLRPQRLEIVKLYIHAHQNQIRYIDTHPRIC